MTSATASPRYSVMEATKAAGISRQAYYKWLNRPKTRREIQDEELLALIQRLELEHQHSVGSGKMVRLIRKEGSLSFPVGKKRVRRVMKANGIKADYRQARRNRKQAQADYEASNLLKRRFTQSKPNHVWVTDTTELTYGSGNEVRLHVMLDLYGQAPIAYLISPTETTQSAVKLLSLAIEQRQQKPRMIHTDRGSAYVSHVYNQELSQHGILHSYSAPGTPADNAKMEHWRADFKSIWMNHQAKAMTLAELEVQVKQGINYFTTKFISIKRNDLTVAEYYEQQAI